MEENRTPVDKEIKYSHRVLIGNWYEKATLEEHKLNKFLDQMKSGNLMLAKFRQMNKNINTPTVLTQSTGSVNFGSKVSLLAPHVPNSEGPSRDDKKGLLLGGRITSNEINYTTVLHDGCTVVGLPNLVPTQRSAFVITSADYCKRDDEYLKYNQEFLLAITTSVAKNKPLYLRYDPNAIPGLIGMMPLYLSEHPVSNTRWRVLPVQKPNITRFEQEGQAVQVNTDVVINHCATNTNLGINLGAWVLGFGGKIAAPLMKTRVDIFGRELLNNIWQIYIPYTK